MTRLAFPFAALLVLVSVAHAAVPSAPTDVGPLPVLPKPHKQLIPTLKVAKAVG